MAHNQLELSLQGILQFLLDAVPALTHTHKRKRNLKNKYVPCSGSNPASKEYQRQLALANTGMYTCAYTLTTQVSLKEKTSRLL